MCISQSSVMIMLLINSMQDIRKREIFPIHTIIFGICGIFYTVGIQKEGIQLLLMNLVPGAIFFLLALVFKGQIGMGDVIVMMAVCTWQPMEFSGSVLMSGMFLMVFAAIVRWMMGKTKKEIPFIPFLLAGEIATVVLG